MKRGKDLDHDRRDALSLIGLGGLMLAGAPGQAQPVRGGDPLADAQAAYDRHAAMALSLMLARPECADPRIRAQAYYTLSSLRAGVHAFHVAPRQQHPRVYRETIWGPFESPWGGPASDFVYSWLFLDGRNSYRITGRRGTTRFADMQVFTGYFANPAMRGISAMEVDAIEKSKDGNLLIMASATPQPGNWLKLDAGEHEIVVQIRDAFYDWAGEEPLHLEIETIGKAADDLILSPDVLAQRIEASGRLIEQTVHKAIASTDRCRKDAGGDNAFGFRDGRANANGGASPRAGYSVMAWNVKPDDALIIEFPEPKARYWSIQLVELWWNTLDFTYHQSGLNGIQARKDDDGMYRCVLSHVDPGVPNWLDPVQTVQGQAFFRTYDGALAGAPTVTLCKVSEVRKLLPKSTPTVSPAERTANLAARARASLMRWRP